MHSEAWIYNEIAQLRASSLERRLSVSVRPAAKLK